MQSQVWYIINNYIDTYSNIHIKCNDNSNVEHCNTLYNIIMRKRLKDDSYVKNSIAAMLECS